MWSQRLSWVGWDVEELVLWKVWEMLDLDNLFGLKGEIYCESLMYGTVFLRGCWIFVWLANLEGRLFL